MLHARHQEGTYQLERGLSLLLQLLQSYTSSIALLLGRLRLHGLFGLLHGLKFGLLLG